MNFFFKKIKQSFSGNLVPMVNVTDEIYNKLSTVLSETCLISHESDMPLAPFERS